MDRWQDNKHMLDHIFFSDNDIMRKGSEAYKDFWLFLEKYERLRSQRTSLPPSTFEQDNEFKFPATFDSSYKIDLALTNIDERFENYTYRYDISTNGLKMSDVMVFKQIILYYYDFLQKQKFKKLLKLKQDQMNLPIWQYKEQIIYALKCNSVVLVAGDTGCGKSTQVPQYLLEGGFAKIACTQPRKIACVSLAKRVSFETLNEHRSEIGFQVRFETNKTTHTKVLFLTEGVLLRQFQSDPELSMYNVVVVDEVHERHMNGDFLLGVLKCLLQQRSDLRIVLMSATINIEMFSLYFNSAPVIQVPGRLFPIELQYVAHLVDKDDRSSHSERFNPSPYLKILQLIDKKYPSNDRGDLLIFMSGMSEISSVVDAAREYALKTNKWIILPLHSALSIKEQDKIFDLPPEGVRKCIVSTNIAETSITIDGVRFVVDSGKVKEMRYDPMVKMQCLQEFWISQASGEQRKGRAGRTGPGVCFRMYTNEDYDNFSQYTTSEIHRVPLDSLVLQMASLGLRDATRFPFIEPPPANNLVNAMYVLKQQGALTRDGDLTPLGHMLARLPVDISLGKMLIMGSLFSLVDSVLVVAAALSVQSPFTTRIFGDDDSECQLRRKELYSEHGDPFTLLNIYNEWILVKSRKSSHSRKWCKRRGIEEQRLFEISKLKQQFEGLLKDYGLIRGTERDSCTPQCSKTEEPRSQLLGMKRQYYSQKSRKRKFLKLYGAGDVNMDSGCSDEEEKEHDIDIQDIDFKLNNNLAKLEATSKKNRRFTYQDLNLLKLIISSGLYPQIAVADESNPWRKVNEQVFHSKSKQFLALHPTAVFSLQPEFLGSLHDDKLKNDSTDGQRWNCKEFLAYMSLLETKKPYIVNSMRVPVLQTLFLLSSNIATNSDCSTIVVDNWLELSFEDGGSINFLLSDVVRLRKAWDTLLEEKLFLFEDNPNTLSKRLTKIRKLEKIVSLKLVEFLDTPIEYQVRRLLSADSKYMYVNSVSHKGDTIGMSNDKSSCSNQTDAILFGEQTPEDADCISATSVTDKVKGGYSVTPYLTLGCLHDDITLAMASNQAEYLVEHYHCSNCKEHLIGTIIDRMKHNEACGIIDLEATSFEQDGEEVCKEESSQSKKHSYFCELCQLDFEITPVEILKHKLGHE